MGLYVANRGRLRALCDMEYDVDSGKPVTCLMQGAPVECVRLAASRLPYSEAVEFRQLEEGPSLVIHTSIFRAGKTPGEVIREVLAMVDMCITS